MQKLTPFQNKDSVDARTFIFYLENNNSDIQVIFLASYQLLNDI
jgi:hypothetical protein